MEENELPEKKTTQHNTKSFNNLSFFSDLTLFFSMMLHFMICPYTKVEESFNTQATFDILNKYNTLDFDHMFFPGVVPRTFIGASFVAFLVQVLKPILSPLFHIFSFISLDAPSDLLLTRFILGCLSFGGYQYFKTGIKSKFGFSTALCFNIINLVQFHLLFYMSRPLPNTFALVLIYFAFGFWVRDKVKSMFFLLGFTAVIFRSDVLVLITPLSLLCLITFQIDLLSGILVGVFSVVCGVLFSVGVDSYFWNRFIWPEGEVFLYNTVENKSINWGAMPYHWYFTSALPRSLLCAIIFIPFSINALKTKIYTKKIEKSKRILLLTMFLGVLIFVALYSLLPHKELRFIFFSLPIFNLIAALGLSSFLYVNNPGMLRIVFTTTLLIGSLLASSLLLHVSSLNYFGASSLTKLHKYLESRNSTTPVIIHMDAHVTMNGVSQYLYRDEYSYSKLELLDNTTSNTIHMEMFTHLLSGDEKLLQNKNFRLIGRQSGFKGINYRQLLKPLEFSSSQFISTETKIYILERINRPEYLYPIVKWAQRRDKILLNVELSNASDLSVHLTNRDELSFRGKSKGNWYSFNIRLLDDVGKLSFELGMGWVKITLLKRKPYFWVKLSKDTLPFKKDWDNWVDSEREEDYNPTLTLSSLDPKVIQQWYTEGHGTTETVILQKITQILNIPHNTCLFWIYTYIEKCQQSLSPLYFSGLVVLSISVLLLMLHVFGSSPNEKHKQE